MNLTLDQQIEALKACTTPTRGSYEGKTAALATLTDLKRIRDNLVCGEVCEDDLAEDIVNLLGIDQNTEPVAPPDSSSS